jgi:hypothetical protein
MSEARQTIRVASEQMAMVFILTGIVLQLPIVYPFFSRYYSLINEGAL